MVPPSIPTQQPGESGPTRSRRWVALGHIQPFALDVCANWREVNEASSVHLHQRALEDLRLLEAEGRVVLLSAPRAGHGKTHLLGRVAHKLAGEAVIATVPWYSAEDVSWRGCGHGVLHDLATAASRGGVSLQTVCAGVLATLLRRLIQTGRIPSTDPAEALRVLSEDPMELFKADGKARVIGEWYRRHFDQLSTPLAEVSGVDDPDAIGDWLRGFFDYVEEPVTARLAEFESRISAQPAVQVPRLLRLMTTWRPMVLVADHMDGLYRDPAAGVAVGRMTVALTSLPGVHLVLSVNQDLWETTFGRQLPSALEDRLNAHNVALRGMTAEDARDLITLRLREAGVGMEDGLEFLRFLDIDRFFFGRPVGSVSARGLLRHASQMWRHWLQNDEPAPIIAEKAALPAEGFLLDPASVPVPATTSEDPGEDLEKLAAHLAGDAGGREVSLAAPIQMESTAGATLPPSFMPLAPLVAEDAVPENPKGASPPPDLASPALAPEAESPGPWFQPGEVPSQESPVSEPVRDVTAGEAFVAAGEATTFQKLRQMLARLREETGPGQADESAHVEAHAAEASQVGTNGATAPAVADLQARYEALRQEIAATPRPYQVDLPAIGDLVRLAGKRFPIVHYDEVELPGMLGHSIPKWNVHEMEIVFGLEPFSDIHYWKTLSGFMAGRLAELDASAAVGNEGRASQVKLVVFKGDGEAPGLAALLRDDVIPPALRRSVDAIHLDPRSLASIYAMHQIIRETESGSLKAGTDAAVNALADELDFFWKRVTRPKA